MSEQKKNDVDWKFWYPIIGWGLARITFLIIWGVAFASWGFLIGLAIGWLPGLVGGILMRFLWPIPVVIIIILITFVTLTEGW